MGPELSGTFVSAVRVPAGESGGMTENVDLQRILSLAGRTAIVTGAAMGIGRSVARHLAAAGAAVVVADLDGEAAAVTAEEIEETGAAALAVRADVSSEPDVRRLVDRPWPGAAGSTSS